MKRTKILNRQRRRKITGPPGYSAGYAIKRMRWAKQRAEYQAAHKTK